MLMRSEIHQDSWCGGSLCPKFFHGCFFQRLQELCLKIVNIWFPWHGSVQSKVQGNRDSARKLAICNCKKLTDSCPWIALFLSISEKTMHHLEFWRKNNPEGAMKSLSMTPTPQLCWQHIWKLQLRRSTHMSERFWTYENLSALLSKPRFKEVCWTSPTFCLSKKYRLESFMISWLLRQKANMISKS